MIKDFPQFQKEYKYSDEVMASMVARIRELLGSDTTEEDNGILFSDGELTKAEKAKLLSLGIQGAIFMIERGATSFPDIAARMLKGLGEEVRPYLKAFYEGARRMPGMEDYELTSTAEVDAFDLANFDAYLGVVTAPEQKTAEP